MYLFLPFLPSHIVDYFLNSCFQMCLLNNIFFPLIQFFLPFVLPSFLPSSSVPFPLPFFRSIFLPCFNSSFFLFFLLLYFFLPPFPPPSLFHSFLPPSSFLPSVNFVYVVNPIELIDTTYICSCWAHGFASLKGQTDEKLKFDGWIYILRGYSLYL